MANLTVTTEAVAIQEKWAPEVNKAIQYELVAAAAFKDRSSELGQGADTLRVINSSNITASTKSAGSALTPEAITNTDQTFQVTLHQAIAQEVEDIAEIQSKYPVRAQITSKGAYALGRAMEVSATNLFDDNTTQTVGTAAAELTQQNMLDGRTYLRKANAKGKLHGFVPVAAYSGFLKLDVFANSLYAGPQADRAIHQAQIGTLYGTTFYEMQIAVGTAPTGYGSWFADGHFFKLIQRTPKVHTWSSPLDIADIVVMDQIYGMYELQEADEAAAATTDNLLHGVRLATVK